MIVLETMDDVGRWLKKHGAFMTVTCPSGRWTVVLCAQDKTKRGVCTGRGDDFLAAFIDAVAVTEEKGWSNDGIV
jgi:hypothetical protein